MFQGTPIVLSRSVFEAALKDKSISKETERMYKNGEQFKSGKQFEAFICSVLRETEEVEEVIEVPTGCAADTTLKIDIGLVLKGDPDRVYGIQVKSSAEQAEKHLALETVSYKGNKYEVPAVVYYGQDKSRWEVVTSLLQGLGLTLKQDLKNGLEYAKKLGWTRTEADLAVVNQLLKPGIVTRLKGLGACTITPGVNPRVRFVE